MRRRRVGAGLPLRWVHAGGCEVIKVHEVYEGTEILLDHTRIIEVQAVYGQRHNAAIKREGTEGWIRTRETLDEIQQMIGVSEQKS